MSASQQPQLTPMQRALLAVKKLEAQRDAALGAMREPIAIVGMACRFPGGAEDPHGYWELLLRDSDVISELPAARLPGLPLDVPRHAGLIDDPEGFDREFFGLSAAEVERLDPQHRMLLEVAWHAFEDAGVNPRALEGSRTGTFVGLCASSARDAHAGAAQGVYDLTGSGACFAAGRLAYYFGLQGPCMAIDTACSSSLVSVDLACKSLRLGESDLALAGGVNVISSAGTMTAIAATGALSPTGVCRPFDAGANGFVRAEGCGIVVLKRLRDAERDGDRVWATIAGSHVNQDGRSSGLTAPNGAAQETLLREALRAAAITPDRVGYIEAHGTGTSLGDPIEIEALRAVYGAARADGSRCALGSVKSLFGHLEAAAGIAGLIKAALVLWHGVVPKQLHFSTLNPRVSLDGSCLEVPRARRAFGDSAAARVAAVSSFGMSGTNAHVILTQAPARAAREAAPSARTAQVFTCSAHTPGALDRRLRDLARFVDAHPDVDLGGLCRALHTRRAQFDQRAAIVARDLPELRQRLAQVARGEEAEGCERTKIRARAVPKLAFLFSGQGTQYPGMASDLYQQEPVFRAALDTCAELLREQLPEPLLPLIFERAPARSRLQLTQFTQPALFAVQYAMAELLRSHDVRPALLLGHSVGELVAACVAGVLELPDALRLVAARGRLIAEHALEGAMLAVRIAPEQLCEALEAAGPGLELAAINGPQEAVVAGTERAVARLDEQLRARDIKTKRLVVSHPFHSAAMDPVLEPFARVAEQIRYHAPSIPVISSMDAELGSRIDHADYWVEQLRKPVRFQASMERLAALGVKLCVECGPKPTLLAMAASVLEQHAIAGVPTLRSGRADAEQFACALARLYVAGLPVDPVPVDARRANPCLVLPHYPFERKALVPVPGALPLPRGPAPACAAVERAAVERAAVYPGRASEPSALGLRAPGAWPARARALSQPARAHLLERIAHGDARLTRAASRIERVGWSASELFIEHESLHGLAADDRELAQLAQQLALAAACTWLAEEHGGSCTPAPSAPPAGQVAPAPGRLSWRVRRWCASAPGGETVDLLAFDTQGRLAIELLEQHLTTRARTQAVPRAARSMSVQLEAPRIFRGVETPVAEAS